MPREMWALIAAGGTGGAFSPLSDFMPKCMAFLGDRPILRHILDSLPHDTVSRTFVAAQARWSGLVQGYLQDSRSIPANVELLLEEQPGGLANHLRDLATMAAGPLLLQYADVVAPRLDWQAMVALHERKVGEYGVIGTLACSKAFPVPVGIITVDEPAQILTGFAERPMQTPFYVNMAICLLEPKIADYVVAGDNFFGQSLPRALAKGEKLAAFMVDSPWYHIHTVADLYGQHVDRHDHWLAGEGMTPSPT